MNLIRKMMEKQTRLIYFDSAKGFAIYSVILVHLNTFLARPPYDIVHYFVNSYFLSLFFLISGYFAYKNDYQGINLRKKAVQLLIPYFTICLLICFLGAVLYEKNLYDRYIGDDAKGGYWFLLVLYCYCAILKGCLWVNAKLSKWIKCDCLFTLLLAIPFLIILFLSFSLPKELASLFSIYSCRRYYIFFFIGLLLKKNAFEYWLLSKSCFFLATIFYLTIFLIGYDDSTILGFFFWNLNSLMGSIVVINMCKRFNFMNVFASFGVNTLGIYILHYLFIYLLKWISMMAQIDFFNTILSSLFFFLFLSASILYFTNKLVVALRNSKYKFLIGI